VDVAHSFQVILERLAEAVDLPGLAIEGRTDLALGGRKVAGSAQRRGRTTLLHHGTLLYGFDPTLAVRYLKEPARQPAWRAKRHHPDFLGNLPLDAVTIGRRLSGIVV
jgi:lipoate-protein ligase A